jgi:hypothetical protein
MKRLIAIAAAVAFSICANAADYRVADRVGQPGCSVAPLENGRWAIVYTGEIAQPKEEVVQFALRCAAEFSAGRSQEWFAVIDSQARKVNVATAADLTLRAGHFLGDHTPSGGSQGGQQVPIHVLERWNTRSVFQTILTIQPGSGDRASFPGVRTTPQIFPAAAHPNGH